MSEYVGNTEIRMGSDRSFGFVFAAVFAIVAAFPLTGGGGVRWWAFAVSAGFLVVALVQPSLLRPLNRVWFRFGFLLGRIVSPIVMAIIFFVTVTPVGMIVRLRNPDLLKLAFDRTATSYWIPVGREKSPQSSMRRQF